MKQILVLIGLAALGSPVSTAQITTPSIRLFFSTTAPGVDLVAPPLEYGTTGQNNVGSVPVVTPGMTAYFYAMVEGLGAWHAIGIDAIGSSGTLTFINPVLGDPDDDGIQNTRWHSNSDFVGSLSGGDPIRAVAVSVDGATRGARHPVGSVFDAADPTAATIVTGSAGRSVYYLGAVVPSSLGSVFLRVDDLGITRSGGPPPPGEPVYFGFNDAPVLGGQFGMASALPDLIVIPEPNGLALLALGTLCIRRPSVAHH